jgi:hypothetical protein
MNNREFIQKLEWGKEGEHIVANKFMEMSCSVMCLYQFEETIAPKIYSLKTKNNCPDLIVFKNGNVVFVDVKRKSEWKYKPTLSTGIDEDKYNDYKELSNRTGTPFFLVFIQEQNKLNQPTGIYYCNINNEHTRSVGGYYGYNNKLITPMVNFTSESLKRLC